MELARKRVIVQAKGERRSVFFPGYYNKGPQTGWLISNRHLLLTVVGAGSLR